MLKYLNKIHWLIIVFAVMSQFVFAQPGNRKIVRQHNADIFKYIKQKNEGVFELRGNVILEHNGWFIYCDLAFLNKSKNYFDAYHNVRIEKADSVTIFGDTLHFLGDQDLAKMRSNVIVLNDSVTLTTDMLDFNTKESIGYYYNHGKIVNEENVLESQLGIFRQKLDEYIFYKDVILYNDEYVVYTDSIKHMSEEEISYFWGNTEIFGDDKEMYCKKGWYNSKTKQGEAEIDVLMKTDGKELTAEYVFFDDSLGYNKGLNNVQLLDTVENMIINGNFLEYYKDPERILITDHALITQIGEKDSLYLHGDTIRLNTYELTDSIKLELIANKKVDSLEIWDDTLYREFIAYNGVRFYRSDLQGKCDSLYTSSIDSIIYMNVNPVVWSGVNQISADRIIVYSENQEAKKIDFLNSAFIIAEDTIEKYNQVKGKNIYAYLVNSNINYVEVRTSGESIYYVKEENDYTSLYNTLSANINMYFDEFGKIHKITFLMDPKTVLTPLEMLEPEKKKLKNFNWQDNIRPKTKKDVFLKK